MEAAFYKHDSYIEMRRKFTNAWTNLRLELHEQSLRFYKEGYDEFEDDRRFFSIETTENELLFTLTGETVKADARRMFAEHYSYRGKPGDWVTASIGGNFPDEVSYPAETNTLDECNNPFYLPLNKYVYAEFKRRFSEKWMNLSVEVYPSELPAGEMPIGAAELPDDFEMTNLTRVNRLVTSDYFERDGERDVVEKLANDSVLRDGTYPADFETSLNKSGIFVRFKNEKLGVYWERKLNYSQLKDFQAAQFSEESKGNE